MRLLGRCKSGKIPFVKPINQLLNDTESDCLDFKQEFHSNMAELVHDILCLLNSKYDGDRYLVFGVREKDGK
jgi:hypothetical protein